MNAKTWIVEAVFGDGQHDGHSARYFRLLNGWAWCDECRCWERVESAEVAA